jgi:hypothetical protein
MAVVLKTVGVVGNMALVRSAVSIVGGDEELVMAG